MTTWTDTMEREVHVIAWILQQPEEDESRNRLS
jgi:hypothetical protein